MFIVQKWVKWFKKRLNLSFVSILVSLSIFSFIAKSIKLHSILIFLIVAIVDDRPRWMSRDPCKTGFIQIFCIFTVLVKIKKYFFFLYLCYAIAL